MWTKKQMKTSSQKFSIILLIMSLCLSFSVSASPQSVQLLKDIKANPSKAAALIQAAAKANPSIAKELALAVVGAKKDDPSFPTIAPAVISAAAAKGSPSQAGAVVAAVILAVAKDSPKLAADIAAATIAAVPSKAGAITQAAVKTGGAGSATIITETIVTQLLATMVNPSSSSSAKSEPVVNNISITQNVITTNLENKITACGTDNTCKVNAATAAVSSSGTNNATLLSLLAAAIVTKVQQIVGDNTLVDEIKNNVNQAAGSPT